MSDPVPRILLDADAIVAAGFGTSGAFGHLLRDAADHRVELLVPELALAETAFVLRRRFQKHRRALKELPALLRAAGTSPELNTEALGQMAAGRLRGALQDAGVSPQPSPPFDADELVRRILARRKPTKPLAHDDRGDEKPDQREGFRDQLLWIHVREAAKAGPVIFVTGNTRDFAAPGSAEDGRADLHEQLTEDLSADGTAGQVELVLNVETVVATYLRDQDLLEDVSELLAGPAGDQLVRLVEERINEHGRVMDEFTPEALVEGDIEEASLTTLSAESGVEIDDAYLESSDDEPRVYAINAVISGEGDVDWHVSAPTGGDIEAFGDAVENIEHGGGFFQEVDGRVPVLLSISATYAPSSDEWSDITIDYVAMPRHEVERRAKLHATEEFRRLQDLGLAPPDDEIE